MMDDIYLGALAMLVFPGGRPVRKSGVPGLLNETKKAKIIGFIAKRFVMIGRRQILDRLQGLPPKK